jgi:hypothetical protein
MEGLRSLQTVLTGAAIDLLKNEMNEARLLATTNGVELQNDDCLCENRLRYALPCGHQLLTFVKAKTEDPGSTVSNPPSMVPK